MKSCSNVKNYRLQVNEEMEAVGWCRPGLDPGV